MPPTPPLLLTLTSFEPFLSIHSELVPVNTLGTVGYVLDVMTASRVYIYCPSIVL
jgi:hypothetical protein